MNLTHLPLEPTPPPGPGAGAGVPDLGQLSNSVGTVTGSGSFNMTTALSFIIGLLAVGLMVVVAWKALGIGMSDKTGQVDVAARRGAVQGIAMGVFALALVLGLVVGALVVLLRSVFGG